MKYFTKLLLFAFVVFLFSCTNDETPSSDNSVVGTWDLTGMVYTGTSTTTFEEMEFPSSFEGMATDMDCSLEFKDSPQTFVSEGSYTINLKTEIFGQVSEYNLRMEGFMESGPYELKDGQLIVTPSDGVPDAAKIVSLTDNEMVLTYAETMEQSMDGAVNSTTIDGIFTFRRK
ncbi:lipocalin-like domain-containing protein [Echinicola shivajiensis]|uniref:lipocalin family protein n=1 Tax=Echinicola shivajiensis TaxID=1035916 RepID=UPI001BFC8EA9|nr:lipocalin family protein [Echinicola shivajiensis]